MVKVGEKERGERVLYEKRTTGNRLNKKRGCNKSVSNTVEKD